MAASPAGDDRADDGGRRREGGAVSPLRALSLGLLGAALLAGLLALAHTGDPAAALATSGSESWAAAQSTVDSSGESETARTRQAGECVGSLCQFLNNKGKWVQVGVDNSYTRPASTSRLAERRIAFDNIDSQNTLGWPTPGAPAMASPSTMNWPDEQGAAQVGKSHWDWPNAPQAAQGEVPEAAPDEGEKSGRRAQAEIRKEAFRDAVKIVKQQLFCQLRSCGSLEHASAGGSSSTAKQLSRLHFWDDAEKAEQQDKKLSTQWTKVMDNIGSDQSNGMYIPAGDAPPVLNPNPDKSTLKQPPSSFFPHGIVIKEGKPKPLPNQNPLWPWGAAQFPAMGSSQVQQKKDEHKSKGPIWGGGALANHAQPPQSSLHAVHKAVHPRLNSIVRDEDSERRAQAAAAQTAKDIVKELASKDLAQAHGGAGGSTHGARAADQEEDQIMEQSAAAAAEKIVEKMAAKDIASSLHIEKEAKIIAGNEHRRKQHQARHVAGKSAEGAAGSGADSGLSYEQVKQQAEEVLKKNASMLRRFKREQSRIGAPPLRATAEAHLSAPASAAVRTADEAAAAVSGGSRKVGAKVESKVGVDEAAVAAAAGKAHKADAAKPVHEGGQETAAHQAYPKAHPYDAVADKKVTSEVPSAAGSSASPYSPHPTPGLALQMGEHEKKSIEEDEAVMAKDMDAGVDVKAQQAAASRLARSFVSSAANDGRSGETSSEAKLSSQVSGSKEQGQDTPLRRGALRLTFMLVGTNKGQLNLNQLKGFQSQAAVQAISFGDKPKSLPTVSLPIATSLPGLDSAVTLRIDMSLPKDTACAASLRKLSDWTRPDDDLLPLTPLRDAGPPTLRLINVEGCPGFSDSMELMQPRKTDTLAMQGTLKHMQQQQLMLQEKVAAYARQEHQEEARQEKTLKREQRIEREMMAQEVGKSRQMQTLASARNTHASPAEQVRDVLEAETLHARRPGVRLSGKGSKEEQAAKEEHALRRDVEKRAQEQGEARKQLQQLEASFNKVAAKTGAAAPLISPHAPASSTSTPAAREPSEDMKEASFLKEIQKFVSGKGGQGQTQKHALGASPSAPSSPDSSTSAVETTADFITGSKQQTASSASPPAAAPLPSPSAKSQQAAAGMAEASDSIVDKALAAAGISTGALAAAGVSLPSGNAHAPKPSHAHTSQPQAAPMAPRMSTGPPAGPAPTTMAALGDGSRASSSGDSAAIVDKAPAAAGLSADAARPAPAPQGDTPQAASAGSDADANAVIDKALGAAGISLTAASPASSPVVAPVSPASRSPASSQVGRSQASGEGGGSTAKSEASGAPSKASLVQKQQHEIQSALQVEEAKLRRVQQRINRRQAQRQQALSRAGVTASTEQGREQQASLKLQLDSQRLAHVQEELEEHKAERLADSLQKRIQATATGADRRDMLAMASAKVESLRREARRELEKPL